MVDSRQRTSRCAANGAATRTPTSTPPSPNMTAKSATVPSTSRVRFLLPLPGSRATADMPSGGRRP
jgi:hypothetical protein